MPVGFGTPTEVHGHPPRQQARLRGLAGTEFLELDSGPVRPT
jgi:hypothetical protein